jgi:hypothetical protein
MSYLPRNMCHAVPAYARGISQLYFKYNAYKSKPIVRDYIKFYIAKECQKPGGLDSQGAVIGELMYVHRAQVFRYLTYPILPAADATAGVRTDESHFTRCSNSATCTTIACKRHTQKRVDGPIGIMSISPTMPTISKPPRMRTPPLAPLKILCFVCL